MKRAIGILLTTALIFTFSITAFAAAENTGFSDVDADAWYADAVSYVSDNNIMNGTSDTTFAPLDTMTRAMLASVLYRAAEQPAVTDSDNFTDTADGTWYTDAVLWASQQGIISGYGNGLFGTNDLVTREQIATLLWRFAGQPTAENVTRFADESSIYAYALNAVHWARANGIVSGRSGNLFDPSAGATRAEVATILRNYLASGTDTPEAPVEDTRILVAYFSRAGENYGVGTVTKGNTQIVAEMIAEETGGDLFHIQTATPYPVSYEECTQIAQEEQRTNARPALDAVVSDFDNYDVIFLGYPIWWGDMPMAVYTFIESYDFSGKTVIPFSTNAGSGIAGTVRTITDKLSGAAVESSFAIAGTTAQNDRETTRTQVRQWLGGLSSTL